MAKERPIRLPKNPKPKEWLAEDHSLQYIADYKPFNFVDGEGVRCSLYVSGCLFNCPGCYNKAAQNFSPTHRNWKIRSLKTWIMTMFKD